MFYGDEFRWFIATVVDNRDPLKLGRVLIRIIGLHGNATQIQNSKLPWAAVILPTTEPGVSGLGANPNLMPGARVIGYFIDGKDSQSPIIFGSIPRIEDGRAQAGTNTPSPAQSDYVSVSPHIELALEGADNTEKAFNFFISKGFTAEQSAGIVGNLMQESGINISPTTVAAGEGSVGIAQWNPEAGRLDSLKDFASRTRRSHLSLETQLDFIIFELNTMPFLGLTELKAADTVREATLVFQDKFERPNVAYAATETRIRNAELVFGKFE
jgi:hypothetical protein